jgi:hypothetical protein
VTVTNGTISPRFSYNVSQSIITEYTIPFTTSTVVCGINNYAILKTDFSAIESSIFSFTNSSRNFSIWTNDNSKVGIYNMYYVAYFPQNKIASAVFFQVEILPSTFLFNLGNSAPYFTQDLVTAEVTAGKILKYKLPPMLDKENDKILVKVNYGVFFSFVKFVNV